MSSNTLFLKATHVNSDVPKGLIRYCEISLNKIKSVIIGSGFTYMILHGRQYCLIFDHAEYDNIDQIQIYDNPDVLTDDQIYDNIAIITDDPILFIDCDREVTHQFIEVIRRCNHIEKLETDKLFGEFFREFKLFLTQDINDYLQDIP